MGLNIILNAPQLLVTPGVSPSGIVPVGSTGLIFGQVQQKYDTCDKCNVTDWVLFDIATAKQVMYGSTIYWVVNDSLYLFKEPAAL